MFFKLFNWLSGKIPYTLAVAVPNTFWAVLSAVFGFFLIFTKANFEITGSQEIFTYTILISTIIAMLLVFLEFGILKFLGTEKFQREDVKIINNNILDGHISLEISDKMLLQTYNAFGKLYRSLLIRNVQYTSAVVTVCILMEWLTSSQLTNIPIIIIGGAVAISISFICTIPLYELLLSPARRECKMLLSKRGINFKEDTCLSLKIKSKFFIILTALALGVILMLIPALNAIHVAFFIIILLVVSALSKLIFESIYRSFLEIKESAQELESGKTVSFFSGSLDKEIIDLSKSLNVAADEIYNVRNTLKIQVAAKTRVIEDEKISLEQEVERRTKELRKRVSELEKIQKLTVGREIRMIELKKKIDELKRKLKKNK